MEELWPTERGNTAMVGTCTTGLLKIATFLVEKYHVYNPFINNNSGKKSYFFSRQTSNIVTGQWHVMTLQVRNCRFSKGMGVMHIQTLGCMSGR